VTERDDRERHPADGRPGDRPRPAPAGGPAAARAARLTRDPVCTSYG